MVCSLCHKDNKLIRAHIIPEAFFRVLREGQTPPLLVSGTRNTFPKRTPIGVYDQTILCGECEKKFDSLDDYGVKTLLTERDSLFKPIVHDGKTVVLQAEQIDQNLLLRFFISVLWRASVSKQDFYKRVNLGVHEEVARKVLTSLDEQVSPIFSVVLSGWNSDNSYRLMTNGLMDPIRHKWQNGANAYRFYFGQVVANIKVDRRPTPDPLDRVALLNQNVVTIVMRDFERSKDFAAMLHTAKLAMINSQK